MPTFDYCHAGVHLHDTVAHLLVAIKSKHPASDSTTSTLMQTAVSPFVLLPPEYVAIWSVGP